MESTDAGGVPYLSSMALLLYTLTAAALLAIAHRGVRPLSRTASLIVFLLPFCFTGFALVSGRVYAPIDLPYATEPLSSMRAQYGIDQIRGGILSDVSSQMIPWRKTVQWSLAHRQWPLWNPFVLSGDILAAAAQPAPYSPFTLIACLMPAAASFTYSAAIAFFIAAFGAFLFARELGCGEASALIAAAAWMASTDIAFFVLWPLGFSWTFLPFVLLGVRRVVRDPSVRSSALLAAALTLMLLAGHPETALHVVFVGTVYAVFEIAFRPRQIGRAVRAGVAAGVLALLICAVYLLPVLEAIPQTEQNASRIEFYAQQPHGTSTPNVVARLLTDFFPSLYLAKWTNPNVNDLGADSIAVGSVALALALFAIWRARSRDTWFFAGLALFGLLARIGWRPVAVLLQKLPLFDVAVNERLSFAAAFALAVLAAIGTEEFLRRGRERGAGGTAAAVLVVICTGTLLLVNAHPISGRLIDSGAHTAMAEVAGLACAAFVLFTMRKWAVPAILGLILVQRAMTVGGIYPAVPARAAYPPVPIFASLKTIGEPFRVTGFGAAFIPNQSAMYELEDVRGYEAMTLRLYTETWRIWCAPQLVSFNKVDDLTRPFLSFLNVRYAIAPANYPLPAGWRVAASQPGVNLLENPNVIARAFVPSRVKFYGPAWEAVNGMTDAADFRERAWIRGEESGERENGPGNVSVARRPYGFNIDADMQRGGWVVVSEPAWKGWRAYVDGGRVEPQLANAAFLSVHVPQGRHRVKLIYRPQSFVVGRAVTIATLLIVAIVSIVGLVHHRRRLRLE